MRTFTVAEVAAKFEPGVSTNPVITVVQLYHGPLLNVTLAAAEKLVEQESNLVVAKKEAPAPPKANTLAKEKQQ